MTTDPQGARPSAADFRKWADEVQATPAGYREQAVWAYIAMFADYIAILAARIEELESRP